MRTLPLLVALAACGGSAETPAVPDETPAPDAAKSDASGVDRAKLAAFAPLPDDMQDSNNPITPAKVELGRMLYYEARVSKNHDISCNTCHMLDKYGVDGTPTSTGHRGQKGDRNAPTVYNAGKQIAQFWDGREPDLVAQAKGPPLNPIEMAMADGDAVAATLRSIPGYEAPFKAAFPDDADPITYDNFARAIAAFEATLVTPSPWDAYLGGDDAALTDAQKAGLKTFMDTGCTTCHSGAYLGGQMYQKAGLVKPWPNQEDKGRGAVTGNEGENLFFKVPVLRNITETGPYFHDGSVADLETAVKMMADHQLNKQLSDDEAKSIVAFLGALKGELPADKIAKPELPESGPDTPKPDPT